MRYRRLGGVLLLVGFHSQTSLAVGPSFLDIKGIHQIFEVPDLSPVYGIKEKFSKVIDGVRFEGNLGAELKDVPCSSQIPLKNRGWDCPQDFSTALTQQLYPSPLRLGLVQNQGTKKDPASVLSPEEIGQILWRVHEKEPRLAEICESPDSRNQFVEELNSVLYISDHPDSNEALYLKRKDLETNLKDAHCLDKESGPNIELIQQLESNLNWINDKYNALKKIPRAKVEAGKFYKSEAWKVYLPLTSSIVGTKCESLARPRKYPPNYAESLLLSYFWDKAKTKRDVLRLAKGMPLSLKPEFRHWLQFLDHPKHPEIASWEEQRFSREDYFNFKKGFDDAGKPTKEQVHELLSDPEKAIFMSMAQENFDMDVPVLPGLTSVHHKSLGVSPKTGEPNTYSNCGERSLLNLFKVFLFNKDTGALEVERLREIEKKFNLNLYRRPGNKHPEKEKGILSFFEEFRDSILADTPGADYKWSRDVACDLNRAGRRKVRYLSPTPEGGICQLDEGFDNFLGALEVILGDSHGEDSLTQLSQMETENNRAEIRAKKLDRICQLFSKEDSKFEWRNSNTGKKTTAEGRFDEIQFLINGKPQARFSAENRHFSLGVDPSVSADWSWRRSVSDSKDLFDKHPDLAPLFTFSTNYRLPLVTSAQEIGGDHKVAGRDYFPSILFSVGSRGRDRALTVTELINHGLLEHYPMTTHWITAHDDATASVSYYEALVGNGIKHEDPKFSRVFSEVEKGLQRHPEGALNYASVMAGFKTIDFLVDRFPNIIEETRKTAEMARMRNFKVVEYLIKKDPKSIQQQDNYGNTVLHHAASSGDLREVESILARYPESKNKLNKENKTPADLVKERMKEITPSLDSNAYLREEYEKLKKVAEVLGHHND